MECTTLSDGYHGNSTYNAILFLEGKGVEQELRLHTTKTDLGVAKLFHPVCHTLEISNPYLDHLDYRLLFNIDEEDIIPDNYDHHSVDTLDLKTEGGYKLTVRDANGILPPRYGLSLSMTDSAERWSSRGRSRKSVSLFLWMCTPKTYTVEITCADAHNERISRDIVTIQCTAVCPCLRISDTFSSGVSKNRVTRALQVHRFNDLVQASLTHTDIHLSKVGWILRESDGLTVFVQMMANQEDIAAGYLDSLPSVDFNFGTRLLNGESKEIYIQLFNPTEVDVEWRWISPHDSDSIIELCEEPLPAESAEEQLREMLLNNNVFSFDPPNGHLLPESAQTVRITYHPIIEGTRMRRSLLLERVMHRTERVAFSV